MSKFVLIDQSIEGKGGHYLEYATNVLHAARKEGYEICLATNRKFTGTFDCEVFPVYSYNIWGRKKRKAGFFSKAAAKVLGIAGSTYRSCRKRVVMWKYSACGEIMVLTADQRYAELLEMVLEKNVLLLIPLFVLCIPAAVLLTAYRLLAAAYRLAVRLPLLRSVGPLLRRAAASIRLLWEKASSFLSGGRATEGRWRKDFTRSTLKVLRRFDVKQGDVVFIPTLSETELLGVAEVIKKHDIATRPSWHMVFRRNLFVGREPVYRVSDKSVLRFRKILYRFVDTVGGRAQTCFYTDTERLSAQYERLNIMKFTTLPIPINPELQIPKGKKKKDHVNIVYLGDARREKGYQLLDRTVRGLWQEYVLTGKVRFTFQSNFSFSDMKGNFDLVYGREHMRMFYPGGVELYTEALDSEAYSRLVKSGDIGLLFYDRDNYYARSSGAYIECICCEMPVLVSGASWMAADLDEANYQYREQVKGQLSKLPCIQSPWVNETEYLQYMRGSIEEAAGSMRISPAFSPESEGVLAFSSYKNRAISLALVPSDCQYVFVSYKMCGFSRQGNYVRTRITVYDEYGMERDGMQSDDCNVDGMISVMIPLPEEASYITIEMWNAFYEIPVSVSVPAVGFYHSENRGTLPLGTFGLAYSREEDIEKMLRNMVDHYDHYKENVIVKAREYNEKHTAQNLVRQVCERKVV